MRRKFYSSETGSWHDLEVVAKCRCYLSGKVLFMLKSIPFAGQALFGLCLQEDYKKATEVPELKELEFYKYKEEL